MKQLRFLHTADWHADSDPKKQAKLEASLKQIVEYCKEVKVNAIIHAGDVWERSQKYQFNSGVPIVLRYLHELAKLVDFIFITKGNNSHDEPGSISLLHQIEPNIYAYEYPVCLIVKGKEVENILAIEDVSYEVIDDNVEYIVSLMPYPTKASLISEDSIDNNNAEFIEKFEQIFEHIGEITKSYTCPKLLGFHGNVVGSRLSSGQTLVSQDIMVAPSTLIKAQHDYYALGHIHLRQELNPWMVYSGSIYNKNWGETEQKSFEEICFDEDGHIECDRVLLSTARPMIKLEAEFDAEVGFITKSSEIINNPENSEIRYRVTVKENDRKLITDEKVKELEKYFADSGNEIKIEFNIIPSERESRSEKIMSCKTLLDEVKEYATVINEPVNGTIGTKVLQLQEGVAICN